MTYTVPIYEGYALPHAVMKTDFAGKDLTDYLLKLLKEIKQSYNFESEIETVREIKEKVAYVALDYQKELSLYTESTSNNKQYELPDGNTLTIDKQRIECPEILFNLQKIGKEYQSIHELTYKSITKCDVDLKKDFYGDIVLAGGNTMFEGFQERLSEEIVRLAPPSIKIKIISPPERNISAWIGGSILSLLSTFQSMWISKKEYQEFGPEIVNKKCF